MIQINKHDEIEIGDIIFNSRFNTYIFVDTMTQDEKGFIVHGPMFQIDQTIFYLRSNQYLLKDRMWKVTSSDTERIKDIYRTLFKIKKSVKLR